MVDPFLYPSVFASLPDTALWHVMSYSFDWTSLPNTALWHIMSYSVDWTLGSGSIHEDEEIDVRHVLALQLVSKTFQRCFEDSQGLSRLKSALKKESTWKREQINNLEYALGQYDGSRSVGPLMFDSVEDAREFCTELSGRINNLGRRADQILSYLQSPVMNDVEQFEQVNECPIM